MQLLVAALNAVRGYRTTFLPLEEAILAEVRKLLPPHVLDAFDARLRTINRIQSILGGQEITLYERRRGKVRFPEDGRILAADDSIALATVRLSSNVETSRLKATLFCGRGCLTSIEFNAPSEHAGLEDITGITAVLAADLPWRRSVLAESKA